MRGVLLALLLLAPVVSTAAGVTFLTSGGGGDSTNWQPIVYGITNGAALGATALQPSWAATGNVYRADYAVSADVATYAYDALALQRTEPDGQALDAAAAHAATEHSVTEDGGFQAGFGATAAYGGAVGFGANAAEGGAVGADATAGGGGAVGAGATAAYGGAVGSGANATEGGAVGHNAIATDGGAVGSGANAANGGAVGASASASLGGSVGTWAYSVDGGAVGCNAKTSDGFAGGKYAYATSDGDFFGNPIDAIQLGSGGNSTPLTLQIYTNRLLNADGTIPVERMSLHDGDETAHPDIRALIPELPAEGCTELTGTHLVISGETYHYYAAPSAHYTLSVSNAAPRYAYSLEIVGTNGWSCTLLDGLYLRGSWTLTGTNVVVVAPGTGTVWNVYGRGL